MNLQFWQRTPASRLDLFPEVFKMYLLPNKQNTFQTFPFLVIEYDDEVTTT